MSDAARLDVAPTTADSQLQYDVIATTNGAKTTEDAVEVTKQANGSSGFEMPSFSPQTEAILQRVSASSLAAATTGTPGWEAAREQVLKSMMTSDNFPTPPPPTPGSGKPGRGRGRGRGRGAKTGSPLRNGIDETSIESATPQAFKTEATDLATPGSQDSSTRGRGRGRGRGGGRPRGRGRGGGRGGKRKRADGEDEKDDDDNDDGSESSETYTPLATMTKSGRAVQKPTTFAPPMPSPASETRKRKRPYNRKNPELTVCKVCLRPHSPSSNMIVFCDGCNTPYHRYCHHPPIEQEVVDVPDKEWFCKECKVVSTPARIEPDITTFVTSEGMTDEQVGLNLILTWQPLLTAIPCRNEHV